ATARVASTAVHASAVPVTVVPAAAVAAVASTTVGVTPVRLVVSSVATVVITTAAVVSAANATAPAIAPSTGIRGGNAIEFGVYFDDFFRRDFVFFFRDRLKPRTDFFIAFFFGQLFHRFFRK